MRRGIVFSIIVSIIFCAPVLAYNWSTNPGNGSAENPYQISTSSEWIALTNTSTMWNMHFILTADIDFQGATIVPVARDTIQSNSGFQGTPFVGTLDGGCHVLRNFVINQSASDYVGLFGQVGTGGQIRDLGVESLKTTGRSYVGSLCGENYYGTITSCYATGTVVGTSSTVGGLCGRNSGAITICYVTGAVGVTSNIVGGLCGENFGTITSCFATGTVRGTFSIGGLCGSNFSCATITSCYAKGAVSGTSSYVGGLCGENSGAITFSYATGAVSGTSSYVGGLCGKDTCKIINSFWDIQTSGRTISAGGTGKSTAEMKDINSFLAADWDFTVLDKTPAVWYMPEGDYPKLVCQLSVEAADVTGLPLIEAATQLIQTWPGLNVVLSIEASDTIAEGHVIRQTPAPGTSLPGNSTVTLVIACEPSGYRGSGTIEDPYQIDTPSDWLWLIRRPSDWKKQFTLIADLDFGGGIITPVAPDTNSSQSGFQGTSFKGIFDGRGHVLKNFVINQPASDYVGLFGQVDNGGKIRNLGVESLQLTGRGYVGGLCGQNENGTITTCYATGAVNGTSSYVGGLCGKSYDCTIMSCYATGTVSGTSYLGGLCGRTTFGTITLCYATGAVNGSSIYAGGLCGYNDRGIITSCYATGTVNGTSYVGGLCGENCGTIAISFWDIQTSGSTTSDGGTGKTTGEMKDMNTFIEANWDFAVTDNTPAVWYMPEGDYPGLTCHLSVEVADVTGLHLKEVAAQLVQTWPGLNVLLSAEASDTTAEGHVIRQTPLSGSSLPGNSTVVVVIACKPSGYRGSGTIEDPYQIDTPSDWLLLIQRHLDWKKQFTLTADLDFGGCLITPVAPDTNPSSGFQGTSFTGILDGAGHVLRNFVINQPTVDWVGVFGQVGSGGEIRNLGIEPIQVTGRDIVGGLCGEIDYGTIISSYALGAVSGSSYVGGLCGLNSYGTMTACYATVTVRGITNCVGDLCGRNSGNITSCYAVGAVSGHKDYVGGLCGMNSRTITSCYATGTVNGTSRVGGLCGYSSYGTTTSCYATGAVSGTSYVGGLYGYNDSGTITSCYAKGAVSGRSDLGGLCGYNDSGPITSCYATGAVSGTYSVGGLCGYNDYGAITSCYATGAVRGTNDVGGLCGDHYYGTIITSFWDMQTSGMTTSTGGTGKTTAEMQMLSTFIGAGWDFSGENDNGVEDIWFMRDGIEYPRLMALNCLPIANAGEDAVVFAFSDGFAEVQLDGVGSWDADGDALTYSWYNDANELIATGAEPNVVFGVGEYVVHLIVNDGIEDSEPNACVVTVVAAEEVTAKVFGGVINPKSKKPVIKGRLEFAGAEMPELDVGQRLMLLVGGAEIEAAAQRLDYSPEDMEWHLVGEFEIDAAALPLAAGENAVTLVSRYASGQWVYGADCLKVLNKIK